MPIIGASLEVTINNLTHAAKHNVNSIENNWLVTLVS